MLRDSGQTPFAPSWPDIEKYVGSLATKHLWRTPDLSLEDLKQEGALVFLKIKRRYPDKNVKQFMSILRNSVENRFVDLGRSRKRKDDHHPTVVTDFDKSEPFARDEGFTPEFRVDVKEAPPAVRRLCSFVQTVPSQSLRRYKGEKRSRHIRRLAKAAGISPLEMLQVRQWATRLV